MSYFLAEKFSSQQLESSAFSLPAVPAELVSSLKAGTEGVCHRCLAVQTGLEEATDDWKKEKWYPGRN